MDVYVARQPIFDPKMKVTGYELLYRRSMNNFYEGIDDTQSTAELINNAFLAMEFSELTNGTRAFINFSEDMILKRIPLLLPKEAIVVEVLERVNISNELIDACKEIREQGYILALDDFVFDELYIPLIELAHIIKIEFPIVNYTKQRELIKKYKHKIKFLAEKVETREEYQHAIDMGYNYFQGYFFSKPVVIKGKDIGSLNTNLLRIVEELNHEEPDYQRISAIIETDIDLSYKMLKVANSVFYEAKHEIKSIKMALVRFGLKQIKEWIYLMMLKDVQSVDNKELIKNCLTRAKIMELLSHEIGREKDSLEFFISGMFSSIDVLLNRHMEEIVDELPLAEDVRKALLGENNEIRKVLDFVINCENSKWNKIDALETYSNVTQEKYMMIYLNSLKWVMKINY